MSPSDNETTHSAQLAAADYVAIHTMELSQLCRRVGLDTLGHILEMARLEAENFTRSASGRDPRR